MDGLNDINSNLSAFNHEANVYNFELKLSLLECLYQEVESKLTDEERLDSEAIRIVIHDYINKYPIYNTRKSNIYHSKPKSTLNLGVFLILKKWLYEYEKIVRKLIDVHGMDTLYNDESSMF